MNRHSLHTTIGKMVLPIVLLLCLWGNANAQWETVYYNNSNLPNLNAVEFTTTQYGLVVSDDGDILRTENGGRDWETIYTVGSAFELKDVQFVNSTTAFVIGRKNGGGCNADDKGVIAKTTNYGATWDSIHVDTSLNAVHFVSESIGFAIGNCGAFYKTVNGGQDWQWMATNVSANIRTLHFFDGQIGFIAGEDDVFLKTDDGGDTWDNVDLPDADYYKAITFTSSTNGYLLSINKIHRTTNGGDDWMEVEAPSNVNFKSISFANDNTGYLAANAPNNAGLVFKTTDGASTQWIEQTAGLPSAFGDFGMTQPNQIFFLDADNGFLVGPKQFNRTNTGGESLTDVQFVSGNVIHDITSNCTFDTGEPGLEGWLIEVTNGSERIFTTSDELGNYFLALEIDDYDVSAIAPNTNWSSCAAAISLTNPFDTLILNIPVQSVLDCPVLNVDVSTHALTHCADNEYIVRYANQGTATAIAPYVELTLHEDLTITASSQTYTPVGANTYQFDLDDLAAGDRGSFTVTTFLDCTNAIAGQTHSVEAHIFPDDFCDPVDPNWDGSSLQAEAVCEGDSVTFTVTNVGDVMEASDFIIIIEDHVLLQTPEINLGPFQDTTFRFYPNGNTLRLELNQHPLHPGEKNLAVSVEACGTDASGGISLGYVNQYPEHDGNPFHSLDCQESTTTNTAMKKAYPKGYGAEHYTEANIDLDYHINFQNNGTDTVYTVIVEDTLSQWLDAASIRPGSASHPYEFSLNGNGIARFVFNDIQLPPASVNEAASHGFIKFRMKQLPDNPEGTLVLNEACVVMDYGDKATSNETNHLIEAGFVTPLTETEMEGMILTDGGLGVGDVYLSLTNSNDEIKTDSTGSYTFEGLSPDSSYLVTPSKTKNILNGVNALDLYLIGEHIVGNEPLDTPYKMVAADVDRSASISTLDILYLQKAILLIDTVLHNNDSWRFVESSYTFPNPVDPLMGDLPGAFLLSNPGSDNQIDFTGIKIGDVDDTADPYNLLTTTQEDVEESLELLLEDVELQQGNYYDIPVYVKNTADLLALQFALAFDTDALEYVDLQADAATNLRSDNFGFSFLELGVITVCWYDQSTQETTNSSGVADEESLLFSLRFLAKEDSRLSELLSLQGDFVSSGAYERKGDFKEKRGKSIPELSFESPDQYQLAVDHSALGIFPNPVDDVLHLQFTLDSESDVKIQLANALGQTLKTIHLKERRPKGTYTYQLSTAYLPKGTYFVQLEANGKTSTKKMVRF